jgi:hypothetical protein
LHRSPYPPFGWSSCFPRTIQLLLPASPCSRLSRPQSTIRQSDFHQAFGSSSLLQLVGPYKPGLSLTDLPCSHGILRLHASGTNPGSNSEHSPYRILNFCLPHSGIRSATSITIDFGAIFPFTAVPACKPPCLRFAMAVAGHHARLGTRLRAKLCRGLHFRRLNSMSFQGTTRTDPYVRVYAYGSYHGSMAAKLLAAHRPFPGTCSSRSESGACGIERCSPRPMPFPPQPPQKVSLPCSAGSQVLRHSPTSPARACPPFGLWPSRTGLDRQTKACWRSPGSRACCFLACAGS